MTSNKTSERRSQTLNVVDRKGYICPEKGCNLIPEILSVNPDTIEIVLKCANNHEKKIDIEDYLKYLKSSNSNINPVVYPVIAPNQNDLDNSVKIIEEKSINISNIILTYNKIIDLQENHPDNYYHNQNLINLGNSIKEEDSFCSLLKKNKKSIDKIIEEEIKGKEDDEKEILKKLKEEKYIDLENHLNEKELSLKLKGPKTEEKYKWLRDDGFELISKLIFKNLIEINLANNSWGIRNRHIIKQKYRFSKPK